MENQSLKKVYLVSYDIPIEGREFEGRKVANRGGKMTHIPFTPPSLIQEVKLLAAKCYEVKMGGQSFIVNVM